MQPKPAWIARALLAVWLIAIPQAVADPVLTALTAFGSDDSGSLSGYDIWNTGGADLVWNVYASAGGIGGPLINGGADPAITLPLADGEHTFGFNVRIGSLPHAYYGMNLFFHGEGAPGISVFAPIATTSTPPGFYANSGEDTPHIGGYGPGAGTLAFADGPTTVTLTDFAWYSPGVFDQDRVSGLVAVPDGEADFVGEFTLSVSTVPEPTSVAFALGAVAVGLVARLSRRRRKKRA